jgi:hypothetical protein
MSGWADEPGRERAELGDGLVQTVSGTDRTVVDESPTGGSPRRPAAQAERLAHRPPPSRAAGAVRGAGRVEPADVGRAASGVTPTVTVNIGRVEVRSLPPPPPPAAAPAPGPQPLSLEAYLERRNRGS